MSESSKFLELQRNGNTLQALAALAEDGGGGAGSSAALNGHLFLPRGQESAEHIGMEQTAQLTLLSDAQQQEQAVICYNLGCFALFEDDILTAKLRFTEAVRLRPDYAPALHNLAIAHELMADFEEAREALLRALEADPENGLSRINLALIHQAEGNADEALEILRTQAVAHPGNPGPLYYLCRSLLARGGVEDAREIMERLAENTGWEQFTEIRECRGQALFLLRELEVAEQVFREILAEGRSRPFVRLTLLKVLAAREDFSALLEEAELYDAEAPSPEVQDIIEKIKAL